MELLVLAGVLLGTFIGAAALTQTGDE